MLIIKKLSTLFQKLILIFFPFLSLTLKAEPQNKILKIGIIQEWSNLNPVTSQLASNEALFPFVVRRMTLKLASGEMIADVAEKIPPLKNKIATWKIKKEAKWADGHEINCEDWELGWKIGSHKNVSVDSKSIYNKIISIKWQSQAPKTCQVEYATKDWTYDRDLPPFLPSHLEKSVFEKSNKEPQSYERNTNYITYPNLAGLYNGPYTVSEFKIGSHLILNRNKHFYGNHSNIEQVIIKLVTDSSSLKANLSTEQINAVSAVGFPPDTAIQFDKDFSEDNKSPSKVIFQNSSVFQGLFLNLDNEILKDKVLREALSYSINKAAIVKAFFDNKLLPAESILPPQHPKFKPHSAIYSQKMAKSLLQKSGWKKNKDGLLEKEGKVLKLVFKTSTGIKVLENIQVYICDQFKEIGIQCLIKNEPPRVLLGSSVPHGDYDIALFGQPIPPDTTLTSYFSSKEIPTHANSWAGGNSMRVRSLELDQLLSSFDQEFDSQIRNQIIKKIELYFEKDFTFIPLYHRKEAIVMPKKITGITESFDGTSFQQPELWNFNLN